MNIRNEGSAEWIEGCRDWIQFHRGWFKPYYINFMFDPLPGSTPEVIRQMRRAITKFYGRFSTEFHRDPRSPKAQDHIPFFWLFPDKHVFKHENRASLKEVKMNAGGLHYNGPMLIPRLSHFRGCPIEYLQDNQHLYARHGIRCIDVKSIHDSAGISDYACKTVRRNRADEADILILPRSISELDAPVALLDAAERTRKAMMSATNYSPEVAIAIDKIRHRTLQ